MSYKTTLKTIFNTNHWVVKAQSDGLTTEESLIQPPFFGNCFNWVVGHLVDTRGVILRLLNAEPVLSLEQYGSIYGRGSERMVDGSNALSMTELLTAYDETQTRILEAIEAADDAHWEQPIKPDSETTVGARVSFLAWHDSYHSGQLELLRQLTGKNDVIIP